MKPYRPSIRRLQLEFAQRLARRRMMRNHRRRHPDGGNKALMDNSEPWIRDPGTIREFLEISDKVEASAKQWRERFNASSTN